MGEEYTSGPHKEWDVDAENPDLDISLVTLHIQACTSGASRSGVVPLVSIHALVLLNRYLVLFLSLVYRG